MIPRGARQHRNVRRSRLRWAPYSSSPDLAPKNWEPEFLDYLYLAFTNATAFSPTDTLPLSRWAKFAMLLQSLISLVTAALVVAKAVNALQ